MSAMKEKFYLPLDEDECDKVYFTFEEGQVLSLNDLTFLDHYIKQQSQKAFDRGVDRGKELKVSADIEGTKLGDFRIDRKSGKIEQCVDLSCTPMGGRIVRWGTAIPGMVEKATEEK